jgi:hypothetical protein
MSDFEVETVASDNFKGHYINRVKIRGEYITACFPNSDKICYYSSFLEAQQGAMIILKTCLRK